jgi:hypothetical protein
MAPSSVVRRASSFWTHPPAPRPGGKHREHEKWSAHLPVIIPVPEGNHGFRAEFLNIFLFLHVVFFACKDMNITINSVQFFLRLPEGVGRQYVDLRNTLDFEKYA